jgi:hypothetical protein
MSLQLLVLGSVIGISDNGLGSFSSIDNGLSNLAGNLLRSCRGSLGSLADGLGGRLGAFDDLGLDLLGFGDAVNSDELCLENCSFTVSGGESKAKKESWK